ncbi:hypothetical protein [Pseudoduganella rhizocola]|uniref:hypothetical protein n=1 Tax=Pseudoduganella rhizocola TaxID=3382643 RepID=UPI0038B445DC
MKRIWQASLTAATLVLLSACGGSDDDPVAPGTGTPTAVFRTFTADFSQKAENWPGWISETSDYTAGTAPTAVVFEQRTIPAPFTAPGYFIGGHNNSDDAFLYIKKQYTGLVASTDYTFTAQVNFVSNTPSGCMGVGGAPGESVYVIAAASPTEPKAAADSAGYTKVNIDRGNQGTPGAASLVMGNIGNGQPCDGSASYVAKSLRNTTGIKVKTDAEGKVWVLFGIDSGFEATSSIYVQNIVINFTPVTTT